MMQQPNRRRLADDYRIAIRELSSRLEDEILRGQECMRVLRDRLDELHADVRDPDKSRDKT